MATVQEFQKHVQQHLDLDIDDHPGWSIIADKLKIISYDPRVMATSLVEIYPRLIKKDPALRRPFDTLFKNAL